MDRRESKAELKKRKQRQKRQRIRKFKRNVKKAVLILAVGVLLCAMIRFFIRNFRIDEIFSWLPYAKADIVVDAGHGGDDGGAFAESVIEKEINLEIAKKTRKLLQEAGYDVAMTRKGDRFVELSERARFANKKKAKIFVSIHCNSSEEPAEGIETFYGTGKDNGSYELANMIQEELIQRTGARDRGVKEAKYTVIMKTNMPSVLVETGFLNDENERTRLSSEEYQNHIAEAIAEGIGRYLEE